MAKKGKTQDQKPAEEAQQPETQPAGADHLADILADMWPWPVAADRPRRLVWKRSQAANGTVTAYLGWE